jgi:hypothetical protein
MKKFAFAALALLFAGGLRLGAMPQQTAGQPADISPEALAQIDALIREKESRTPTQQKMDSQLIYELKMRAGAPIAPGVSSVETDVPYAPDGHTILDVNATVTDDLLSRLRGLGAEVLASSPESSSLRIHLDIDRVEALAAMPDVAFIQPRQDAVTSRMMMSPSGRVMTREAWTRTRADRRAFNRASLEALLRGTASRQEGAQPNVLFIPPGQGSRASEGDVTHRAYDARGTFHVDGTGIKIGVLSDGVTNLAASQALGDLGPVTVLAGQAGNGDEGTAMLEIIHDLAPGARLYFATAFTSITNFAQNIRDLRTAGCDIIVDDVFYFVETPFQDGAPGPTPTNGGAVIQAVKDVTATGALYFSSAGNSGNLNDGTAGVWEGDFVDGGPTGAPLAAGNRLHSFGAQTFNTLTVFNTAAPVSLYWSDPLGGSSNDYDLFRLNAAGTSVIGSSTNIQNGTQDPIEQVSQSTTSPRIVIVKKASALPRYLHLNANRGRFQLVTAGQTHGHSTVNSVGAYGVAATPAVGPFPNAFSTANVVETFSSDGPRRIFYEGNGTPITPGNVSSTGGLVLNKPDITAADGVSVTGVGGFPSPFFGTSAAAPHSGAIAALLEAASPGITQAQVRAALAASALDIETPGVDRDSGVGIIMAQAALIASGAGGGTAFVSPGEITATEHPGNANGVVNAGEGAQLVVQLRNLGVADATAIDTSFTTSTPGITIMQPSASPYANLAAGGSGVNSVPWFFTVAGDAPCPLTADFTMHVTYTGGTSPATFNFKVPVGPQPSFSILTTMDAIAPPSSDGVTASTGSMTGRHFRDGVASVCGTTKAFPGITQPGTNHQYDNYAFSTCSESVASCATVLLQATNSNLFSAAYVPSFNPADLSANFKADAGASSTARTYAFDLAGGAQTFAVVVEDVPVSPPLNSTLYRLTVSGPCIGSAGCATPNHVPVARAKNVTVAAGDSCIANASIDDGSSDADGDSLTITQSPAGPYPLGSTTVLLTVTDPKGATSQATGVVTVVDQTPPSLTCFVPITVNVVPGTCSAPVTFASTASDSCSPPVSMSSNAPSGSLFVVGTTNVTTTATDAAGNSASCTSTVTVVDNEAPGVTDFSLSQTSLWPPNHAMIDVAVNYTAGDNCGGASGSTCVLTVSSNEPVNGVGDGHTSPDWQVVDAHHVRLRAERAGNGGGRVYTLTLTCTDAAGNKSVKTGTVRVPHNQ